MILIGIPVFSVSGELGGKVGQTKLVFDDDTHQTALLFGFGYGEWHQAERGKTRIHFVHKVPKKIIVFVFAHVTFRLVS